MYDIVVKHITWFIIRNEFDSVISIIKRPTFDFKIFGYPGLEAFQNGDKLTKPDHDTSPGTELQHIDSIASYQKRIKYETDRFCTIWYCSYMLYLIVNIASSYTINFFQSTIEEFNPRINRTSTYRDFVYPMWLPFDVSISDGYYLIAFFYQPYAVFFLMGGFITLDCLLLNTITQLKSQVKVISFALEHVDDNIPQAIDATKKNEEIRVVKCIQELQKIFRWVL
ncbi:hypothetical protein JTB14_007873 [Gonioctena quinquepunctata]|nr:hypothetical protein JTB14_007873 [Gonioctena quinquepunctata]